MPTSYAGERDIYEEMELYRKSAQSFSSLCMSIWNRNMQYSLKQEKRFRFLCGMMLPYKSTSFGDPWQSVFPSYCHFILDRIYDICNYVLIMSNLFTQLPRISKPFFSGNACHRQLHGYWKFHSPRKIWFENWNHYDSRLALNSPTVQKYMFQPVYFLKSGLKIFFSKNAINYQVMSRISENQ